jgi:creatinine amidohydrolase/Fe(II)-dependent formamide hydrolase-like protein
MIAPMGKPVICEELTWKDVDKLTKTMKMAITSTAACEQPSPHLPLAVDTVDCSEVAKRVSQRTGVPATIDKIVDLIATILVKFLIVIVFAQKKFGGGERTI